MKLKHVTLGAVILAGLAFVEGAQANINISGQAFHGYTITTTNCFDWVSISGSVYRSKSTSPCNGTQAASASVDRIPTFSGGGATIYIDGHCPSPGLLCEVRSVDYDDTYLGNDSAIGTGDFDEPITLTSAETSDWGYTYMFCTWGSTQVGSSCRLHGFTVTP